MSVTHEKRAEDLGLIEAAMFLDKSDAISVEDVFVKKPGVASDGIDIEIEDKRDYILKQISEANDKFDMKVHGTVARESTYLVRLRSIKDD